MYLVHVVVLQKLHPLYFLTPCSGMSPRSSKCFLALNLTVLNCSKSSRLGLKAEGQGVMMVPCPFFSWAMGP